MVWRIPGDRRIEAAVEHPARDHPGARWRRLPPGQARRLAQPSGQRQEHQESSQTAESLIHSHGAASSRGRSLEGFRTGRTRPADGRRGSFAASLVYTARPTDTYGPGREEE
jgi:hypothetical protein